MKPALIISGIVLLSVLAGAQEVRLHGHPPPQLASHRPTIWHPPLNTSWQWQLTTPVDESVKVQMYDIDMFDNNGSVVASLHKKGRKVVCYIDVGTWENWRPDANVDGYTNDSGFPLTYDDQIAYNTFIAKEAPCSRAFRRPEK